MAVLVNFTVVTDRHLPHNRPDIVYVSNRSHVYLIDFAVSVMDELLQNLRRRCRNMQTEVRKMWQQPVTVVPVILGALGSIPTSL